MHGLNFIVSSKSQFSQRSRTKQLKSTTEFHYLQVPVPEMRLDVFHTLKARGLFANISPSIYFCWSYHSASKDFYDFEFFGKNLQQLFGYANAGGYALYGSDGSSGNLRTNGLQTRQNRCTLSYNEKLMRAQAWDTGYNKVGGAVNVYGIDSYPGGTSCTNINSEYSHGGSFYDDCLGERDPGFSAIHYKNNIAQLTTLLSLYMAYGGTNWGDLAAPVVYTPHDYSAPLRETRQVQDKLHQGNLMALFSTILKDLLKICIHGRKWDRIWARSLYNYGRHILLYSSASILTYGVFDKHILVLYSQHGQVGQFAIKESKSSPSVHEPSVVNSTTSASRSFTDIYAQGASQKVLEVDGLMIYLLEQKTAWKFWAPPTYSSIQLTDFTCREYYGSVTALIPGTIDRTISLPVLVNWRSADSLPEKAVAYEDSKWTVANKTATLSPMAAPDIGNATLTTTTATLSILASSLNPSGNAVTVVVDYQGHDETSTAKRVENSCGILGASLCKIQGHAGGSANIEALRGSLNESALYNVTIGLLLGTLAGTMVRVMIWNNGYQYGKYVPQIGPQTRFLVPPVVLNNRGLNGLTLRFLAQTDTGAKLSTLELFSYGAYNTDIVFDADWSLLQSTWDASRLEYT
ncbi:putative beta-galactosidase [Calycina marina]|uniref:beta-galactosidase n=1 Tax=Calycina marina TaxID=1763456 RepID=A0A9P7Z8Y1_9HELO|nr:putative beta-galactosidase [Calycina marina]